jgi:HKD family nuclease
VLIVQNAEQPAAIRNALVDLIALGVTDLRVASAYVTSGGSRLLLSALEVALGADLARIPKTLVTSLDFGLTEPAALRTWSALENTRVYVAGADRLAEGTLIPARAFHAKLYAFGRDAQTSSVLVGSANLTGRGLTVNTEAAWAHPNADRDDLDRAFALTGYRTTILTDALLADYDALRKVQPAPPGIAREVQPVAPPAPLSLGAISLFRDRVESGSVDPAHFGAMWVQVIGLQGGSASQLELPRGGHRFFGLHFDHYDQKTKITIGELTLRSGLAVWEDKLLTWHGDNQMERMNLPTRPQGGFDYHNTAIMFRRLEDGSFELIVAPWESDLAHAWRQASTQRNTLFRLGRTARVVGLV